ncbi:MAG: PD40 domain-containing protein [Acidobacteriaceae bacterium]|nr:PD40 domain-containing protein [Acidobacteriaceae bacterium]
MAFAAAWSADGRELIYESGNKLHIALSDGTYVRELKGIPNLTSRSPWGISDVCWSPDGKKVRFTWWPGLEEEVAGLEAPASAHTSVIWELSIDGRSAHLLLPSWHHAQCCGTWTSDGRYFVFNSEGNLWAIREKTSFFEKNMSQPVQLTSGPMVFRSAVASPDDKRLFAAGWQPRSELLRYDPTSRNFSSYLEGIQAEGLDFSRDGKWIAYDQYPEGTLWRATADGSERQQLTFPPLKALWPRWSPDQKYIAFTGLQHGASRIYVMPSGGGNPRQVTHGESGGDGDIDPTWFPDGSSLVFGAVEVGNQSVVREVNLSTGKVSPITGSEGLGWPRVSPDGRFLLVVSSTPKLKLMLFDMQIHKASDIATADIGVPSWSLDGEYAYFDTQGRDPAFFRMRIRDRKLERIVGLKDIRRTAANLSWTGVAPDGSLLIQHNAGSAELYALDWETP